MGRNGCQVPTTILGLVIALCLFAGACSVDVAELSARPTSSPTSDSTTDTSSNLVEAPLTRSEFDTLLVDQFGWLDPDQIGRVRLGVLDRCGSDGDEPTDSEPLIELPQGLAAYFDAGGVFDKISVLGPACSALEQRGLSPDAATALVGYATWDEAIEASFERVVWWYSQQLYGVRAEVACRTGAQLEELDREVHLSSSAAAELAAFVNGTACALLSVRDDLEGLDTGPTTEAGPRAVALSGHSVSGLDHQLVYRNPNNEQYLDVFRLDVATGRVTGSILHVEPKWVDPDDRRNIVPGIAPSPDGSSIAYIAVAQNGQGWLVAADATGESPKMLAVVSTAHSALAWAPDGDRLFYEHQGPWGEPALNVVTRGRNDQQIVVSERSRLKLLGATGEYVVYVESDHEGTELVRLDINTYERVDSIELAPSRSVTFESATNTVTAVSRRDGSDPQRAVIYGVEGSIELVESIWFETREPPAKLSPDGKLLAFVTSEDLDRAEVHVVRRDDGGPPVLLRVYDAGPGVIDSFVWGPSSSTIYFSHKRPGRASHLFVGTLDGEVFDLGLDGIVEHVTGSE